MGALGRVIVGAYYSQPMSGSVVLTGSMMVWHAGSGKHVARNPRWVVLCSVRDRIYCVRNLCRVVWCSVRCRMYVAHNPCHVVVCAVRGESMDRDVRGGRGKLG